MDFTPIARLVLERRARRFDKWLGHETQVQEDQLRQLLSPARHTLFGRTHHFDDILNADDIRERFTHEVPAQEYEAFRPYVMRMIDGEPDILWKGVCTDFAQSSGTSGGRSKYIPVTRDSLHRNHYAGAADVVAAYLHLNPESRLFSGKGFILGGSFETQLRPRNPRTRVGDLSATLISHTPFAANLFRIPDKKTALLADWEEKLERLADCHDCNVTNLSGVPSWFLRVIQKILDKTGSSNIREIWKNLEVFFHGGISFEPYRLEYSQICKPTDENPHPMHYFETYNASEGFFAVQSDLLPGHRPMRLLLDIGIYYEFIPLGETEAVGINQLHKGKIYEMVITSCNGLWRYRIGDTIRIESLSPLLITIAGRTRSFINAFGEEVMETNSEEAVAAASAATGAKVRNYTVAPIYTHNGERGAHQWLIEWDKEPDSLTQFRDELDRALCRSNSDYAAKRSHTIFLDPPLVTTAPDGLFDRWLVHVGSGKLGGQRKIPRLSNDRHIIDSMLKFQK